NIPSAQGREDYVRVRLSYTGDQIQAEPMFGKSGLLSTMVKADGLVKIDLNDEGLDAGSMVKVRLFL
ncbi:MAG: molybdopterin molybdenumtransferase MoeA, partial [Deltaproteobacteria bacterium]|nr:molybdopterin molybdenumtransferase MoeA [Deltaproteobacteria bacterium]